MPNSKETHKNATPKAVIPESIRTLSKTNRNPVTLGYARVSTEQQNTDRQLNSLKEAKISDEHIFVDYASGKDFARSAFIALTKVLRPGDTLVISSLDRFGRSFELIPAQWFEICFSRHVNIRVLDNPLLNMENGTTRSAMDLLVQTLIFVVYSYMADEERNKIKQRQAQGIAAAKERGVRFGRPQRALPECFSEVLAQYHAKEITGATAAKLCEMPTSTFYSKARKIKDLQMAG
ncbi:MAG: recombinase family protein [Desulfovibrio sp.]|nr:recombinase family protein [Desulfovibrio sp.]